MNIRSINVVKNNIQNVIIDAINHNMNQTKRMTTSNINVYNGQKIFSDSENAKVLSHKSMNNDREPRM